MEISHSNTLLLIDEETFVLSELTSFFSRHGYNCISTDNPEYAIELFERHPEIRIVLTSLNFAALSGLALLSRLNETNKQNRPYEAVVLTGDDDKSEIIQAMRSGITECYQKPLDFKELLLGVQRVEQRITKPSHEQQLVDLNIKINQLTHSLNEIHSDINNIRQGTQLPKGEPSYVPKQTPTLSFFEKLSPRQMTVAQLIAQGMTNSQISSELSITENTVKLYVSQILRITHLKNRTQLALSLPKIKPSAVTLASNPN